MVSFASKIEPSPDWIVGISGLELCLRNCTWLDEKVIQLYPWDVGTDAGPSYTVVTSKFTFNLNFIVFCIASHPISPRFRRMLLDACALTSPMIHVLLSMMKTEIP